jgi:hexosaminidase
VYQWEPVPATLTDAEKPFIIGAQANLWTEYIPTFQQVQYMVLPRMAALCEVQWSDNEQKNYSDFLKRLPKLIGLYERHSYNYSKHVWDIEPEIR